MGGLEQNVEQRSWISRSLDFCGGGGALLLSARVEDFKRGICLVDPELCFELDRENRRLLEHVPILARFEAA